MVSFPLSAPPPSKMETNFQKFEHNPKTYIQECVDKRMKSPLVFISTAFQTFHFKQSLHVVGETACYALSTEDEPHRNEY